MPKGGGKKKSSEPSEPDHDPAWERSVIAGVWDRPATALPDANVWPTWGALRERVLLSCKHIKITFSPSLRDAFPIELVKLSPSKLLDLEALIHCPNLEQLEMNECGELQTVMVWSDRLTALDLTGASELICVKLQCPYLTHLEHPPIMEASLVEKPNHPPIWETTIASFSS